MEAALLDCPNIQVPPEIMAAVVRVESAGNPFAIGVVGGRLSRQPKNLNEAVATAKDLETRGYNYSVGLAQVNKSNFAKYGLNTFEQAFDTCTNLVAGSKILRECFSRTNNDWGKAFSCYYSGNFITGFNHGYVQKVTDSYFAAPTQNNTPTPISVVPVARVNPNVLAVTRMKAPANTMVDMPIGNSLVAMNASAVGRSYGGAVLIKDESAAELLPPSRFTSSAAAVGVDTVSAAEPVVARVKSVRLQKSQPFEGPEQQDKPQDKQFLPVEQNIQISTDSARVF